MMKKILFVILLCFVARMGAEDEPVVQLIYVETAELRGVFTFLPSLLWEGEIVMPALEPGIQVGDEKYYLVCEEQYYADFEFGGDSIWVLADIYEGKDLRGIPFKQANVKEWHLIEDTIASIRPLSQKLAPVKTLVDGQLCIQVDGKTYNAQGILVK